MNTVNTTSNGTEEMISFCCSAPRARSVYLIGDFNAWNRASDPMTRKPDGSWVLQVPLNPGSHFYQFLVDDEPKLDPLAMYVHWGDRHEKVSLIALA
jgi:1,4-alpha-glucan branching enzyme